MDWESPEGQKAMALLHACRHGSYRDVADILDDPAVNVNVNIKDVENDGETPLYYASRYGYAPIVELLLESWADINLGDNNGYSPLIIATRYNHKGVVDILIQAGANLNMYSRYGIAAIHMAAEFNRIDIARALVDNGADINLNTSEGETAVFIAAEGGHLPLAKSLLNNGATVSREEYNVTMASVQRFLDNWEPLKLLKNTRKARTVLNKTNNKLPTELEGEIASYLSGTTGREGVQLGPKRPRYAPNYIRNQERELEGRLRGGKRSRKRTRRRRR